MGAGAQRQKEPSGESKLQGAQTFPGEHPFLCFGRSSPMAELNRKPEARKPNSVAPLGQPPRIRARRRRGGVKLKEQIHVGQV